MRKWSSDGGDGAICSKDGYELIVSLAWAGILPAIGPPLRRANSGGLQQGKVDFREMICNTKPDANATVQR